MGDASGSDFTPRAAPLRRPEPGPVASQCVHIMCLQKHSTTGIAGTCNMLTAPASSPPGILACRAARIGRLGSRAPSRKEASLLFHTGTLPQQGYDAKVVGLNPTRLLKWDRSMRADA